MTDEDLANARSHFDVARRTGTLLLAGITAGIIALNTAGASSAEPFDRSRAYFDDCGPTYCTRYWSVDRTERLQSAVHSGGWNAAMVLVGANPVTSFFSQETLQQGDAMREAADDAVNSGGCLQLRIRRDHKGTQDWGYTTHPGYCWKEAVASYTDGNGVTYHYDQESDSYVPEF